MTFLGQHPGLLEFQIFSLPHPNYFHSLTKWIMSRLNDDCLIVWVTIAAPGSSLQPCWPSLWPLPSQYSTMRSPAALLTSLISIICITQFAEPKSRNKKVAASAASSEIIPFQQSPVRAVELICPNPVTQGTPQASQPQSPIAPHHWAWLTDHKPSGCLQAPLSAGSSPGVCSPCQSLTPRMDRGYWGEGFVPAPRPLTQSAAT